MSLSLSQKLRRAEAEVMRLQRQIGAATCAEIGEHDWVFRGGCNAGCSNSCACSVPVHECSRCGDCDYGENDEAARVVADCRLEGGAA